LARSGHIPRGTLDALTTMSVSTHHDAQTEITTIAVSSGYERPEYENALEAVFLTSETRRILADHTAEGPVWGSEDLDGHLHFLRRIRPTIPTGARVAILCAQVLDYGIARMMQMVTESELPCYTAVFMSREDALRWLTGPAPDPVP
jgi:hypothetical protein